MKLSAALQISALLSISLVTVATAAPAQTPAAHPPSVASASYGNLPLSFEANRGQSDPSVQFLVHGQGYTLFLRPGEAVFALQPASAKATPEAPFVRMRLLGANPKVAAVSGDPQITRTNYFLGNNPAQWRTDIPNYGRVRYRSVYEGIDLVYYGNQRRLEHDFVVAPSANPNKIILSLSGAQNPRIDPATGDLILSATADASLRLLKPVAYQESNGHRTPVSSSYKLLAPGKIGFSIAAYDHARPLIIDPVLSYSTYLGGSGANGNGDQGNGIAVDSAGNAYVVGTAYSTNFPVTGATFQSTNNAALAGHGSTVFVSKLNAAGTALIYSTYLGGSGSSSGGDFGYAIALDSQNNAYIAGATYSTDFPVTCSAFQPTNPSTTSGATTAFVTRLNSTGNALEYSTYLGGTGNNATPAHGDAAQAIAVDPTGNAYITGYTYSSNFPVTDDAFQQEYAGSATAPNAFVTKLYPNGTAPQYSTFLGGSGGDYGNAIAIDTSGDAYVTGSTGSSNFPVTSGVFQPTLSGFIRTNAFVTELNPAGADEVYSTYLGAGGDSAQAIAIDSSGFAYVAGNTIAGNFPLTTGVLEGANNGIGNYLGNTNVYGGNVNGAFVSKLNGEGTALEYSTYLEGGYTTVTGLAVDSKGSAYVTGSSPTAGVGIFWGFQDTPDALPVPSGGNAAFLVKLDPSAAVLNYATLVGGSSNDGATALALDAAGNVYLTGFASSTNFPTTVGAFQTANNAAAGGGNNAFVSKFTLSAESNQTSYPVSSGSIGANLTYQDSITVNCPFEDYIDYSLYITVSITLNTDTFGPPPQGEFYFTDSYTDRNFMVSVPGNTGPGDSYTFMDGDDIDGPTSPISVYWTAAYQSTDFVYLNPPNISDTLYSPGCPPPPSAGGSMPPAHVPHVQLRFKGMQGNSPSHPALASTPVKSGVAGPKFTPPPAIPYVGERRSVAESSSSSQATPACIAPAVTAAPVFSVAAGTYESQQTVTLTDTTPGATIYYTLNGTTPTASSNRYSTPVLVKNSSTLQAIAYDPSDISSSVTSATYTLDAAAPVFSPPSGVYPGPIAVTITSATPTAEIAYTPNGNTPWVFAAYTGPITLTTSGKVYALAQETGFNRSTTVEATYTIQPSTTGELQFVPVTPCRIADTRNATGPFGGPELAAAASRTFDIPQSACNIPAAATAYSLNVTVVPDQSLSYLTLWPAGQPQPSVSTLNSDDRVKANAAITPAGANGGVSVYATDATQFILDIDGYFVPAGTSASGLEFYPLTQCRVADTRNAAGPLGGPFLAGDTSRVFPVQSSACGIPSTAQAYSLNITAVPHTSLGYLTAWPSGQDQPDVSTLNATTGAVTANAAIVPAGASGGVSLYVSDDADVILDVNGYFAPPAAGGLSLYTVTPCRALDTRGSSGAFDGELAVPIQTSACAPPATAQAYVLNATVLPSVSLSYLTLWPAGAPQPDVSTLNADDGAITSNMAIVATANGTIDAFSTDSTQLILDLASYFAP